MFKDFVNHALGEIQIPILKNHNLAERWAGSHYLIRTFSIAAFAYRHNLNPDDVECFCRTLEISACSTCPFMTPEDEGEGFTVPRTGSTEKARRARAGLLPSARSHRVRLAGSINRNA